MSKQPLIFSPQDIVSGNYRPSRDEAEGLLRDLMAEMEIRRKRNPLEFFTPLPIQKKFNSDPARNKMVFGGNRSGKTTDLAAYIIEKCRSKPKQRWWACADTVSDSIEIQQRKIWEFLPRDEVSYAYFDEVNGFRNGKIVWKNKSYLHFKSYEAGAKAFDSDDIDGVWNDEEPPYAVYKEQRMRLIDRNGEMLISMTAVDGITELINEVFEDHEVIESQFAPLIGKDLPRIAQKGNFRFYMLWTTENPHIDQNRLADEIKLLTPNEVMTRVYGIPQSMTGKIYSQFSRSLHVRELDDIPLNGLSLFNVLDPHDRKPWAIGWYGVDATGTVYTLDEYPNRNFNEMSFDDKTYNEYAALIKDKDDQMRRLTGTKRIKRIIDPNFGHKVVQLAERQGGQAKTTPSKEMAKRKLIYADAIDSIEAGHLKVRDYLYHQEKDGEVVVQPRFFIASHCQNHIRHLSRYSYKDIEGPNDDVKDKVGPQEKYKDFSDLVRYLCMANPRQHVGLPGKIESPGKCY